MRVPALLRHVRTTRACGTWAVDVTGASRAPQHLGLGSDLNLRKPAQYLGSGCDGRLARAHHVVCALGIQAQVQLGRGGAWEHGRLDALAEASCHELGSYDRLRKASLWEDKLVNHV